MYRRPALVLTGLLLAATVVLALLLPGTVGAAQTSKLRLTHLSPDTPNVNVTVVSAAGRSYAVDDFGYGNVTAYEDIDPGTYTVQMRLTSDAAAAPIPIGTVQAGPGQVYTAAVLGPRAGANVTLFTDDLTLPGVGVARVRVVQAAQGAGPVAVTWNVNAIATSTAYGTATGYVDAAAGSGTVAVAPTSGAPFTLPADLATGGVYTVVVLQRGPILGGHVLLDALTSRGGTHNGGGGGAGAGGGGTGQYPDDRTPPPTPKSLFSRVGGTTDWQSARASLYGECLDPGSEPRLEGFTEQECKTAADFFLEHAEVADDPEPLQGSSPCDTRWSDGKILVASDGTTDCKKGFGDADRPKSTTAQRQSASTKQFALRKDASSTGTSTSPPPTTSTTTTGPPATSAPATPPPTTGPPSNSVPTPPLPPGPAPAPEPLPAPAPEPAPAPPPNPEPPPEPAPVPENNDGQ